MTPVLIRPFARADRDQLTTLVNAHIAAVTPGVSASVQAVLAQLEREPGEIIVDPWVIDRVTLVAEQRERVVAAAHLLRYGAGDTVREGYRDAGEIRWLVAALPASFWPDAEAAGAALVRAATAQLDAWRVRVQYADGALPGPGVYGVPDAWPHIRALYEGAGFTGHRTETVLVATVDDISARSAGTAPTDLTVRRTLGINGTRFTAYDGEQPQGYIEVDSTLGDAGRFTRGPGWADVGNVQVGPEAYGRGVPQQLLQHAVAWLRLGGIERLLAYLGDDDGPAEARFYATSGFAELTTTIRDYTRPGKGG